MTGMQPRAEDVKTVEHGDCAITIQSIVGSDDFRVIVRRDGKTLPPDHCRTLEEAEEIVTDWLIERGAA